MAWPVPFGGFTCSQATLLLAVQVHPARPVSEKAPFCDAAVMLADVGLIAKLHAGPACVIVMLCEPTVIVPVREGESLFAATVKPADPLPVAVWPQTTVIQLTFE